MGICIMPRKVGTIEVPADEHTLLLIHGNEIKDTSRYHVPLINNGVTVSNAQSRFGGKSLLFNKSRIEFPKSVFDYSTDFTIDWWEMPTNGNSCDRLCTSLFRNTQDSQKYRGVLVGYPNDIQFSYDGTLNQVVEWKDAMHNVLNVWTHWAIVRTGMTLTSYENGKKRSSFTFVKNLAHIGSAPQAIGARWTDYRINSYFIGFMSEFRISDVARWTSNFTPPTEPYPS